MKGYELAFWIIFILFMLLFVTLIAMSIVQSYRVPEVRDAVFKFTDLDIDHLGATKMTAFVHHVYQKNAKLASAEDVRKTIQTVMSSPTFSKTSAWEVVARDIASQLWTNYKLHGVSVELLLDQVAGEVQGATFTRGCANRIMELTK